MKNRFGRNFRSSEARPPGCRRPGEDPRLTNFPALLPQLSLHQFFLIYDPVRYSGMLYEVSGT